jgi:hypothetical protein
MRSIKVWACSANFGALYHNARRALARVRKPRALAHAVRDIVDVGRNARAAEAIYLELSRLCDAELARRGIDRRQIARLVFDRLTFEQKPAQKKREHVGALCLELGLDEKDFWLLAHP